MKDLKIIAFNWTLLELERTIAIHMALNLVLNNVDDKFSRIYLITKFKRIINETDAKQF